MARLQFRASVRAVIRIASLDTGVLGMATDTSCITAFLLEIKGKMKISLDGQGLSSGHPLDLRDDLGGWSSVLIERGSLYIENYLLH